MGTIFCMWIKKYVTSFYVHVTITYIITSLTNNFAILIVT
uniref:Uncharacterized protein n=1 Tax=Siphoviridae sp. ctwQT14 TaxID=2827971 RepID=A0A8S5TJV1_9CAUD|nr:MAG TPA: hypothetical protein [Siphoviridae sp. ctwQT14]